MTQSLTPPRRRARFALPLLTLAAAAVSAAVFAQPAKPGGMQTAVFAGGCFWTMEHGLESIPGVVKAVSGFTGGHVSKPAYSDVVTETTGHVEAVQVTFDPKKISYRELVDRYWRLIDPTDDGGQACDRGPSYHAAVFYASPEQKNEVEASKAAIDKGPLKGRIATWIRPAADFWPAEEYHQHFADRNPVRYGAYRVGCGRDRILARIWGG